jgi:hypothetical protein
MALDDQHADGHPALDEHQHPEAGDLRVAIGESWGKRRGRAFSAAAQRLPFKVDSVASRFLEQIRGKVARWGPA